MMWYGESAALIAIKVKSIMIDFIIKLLCIYNISSVVLRV